MLSTSPFDISLKYVGVVERSGKGLDHPLIQWWLSLCELGLDTPDEIAWCSAFMQHAPMELGLPRTRSARARSWLRLGRQLTIGELTVGFDFVVLRRGTMHGPDVINAPGHVGWFAGFEDGLDRIKLLGGNQGNGVNIRSFPMKDALRFARLELAA